MLKIRLQRVGRKNDPAFRIVVVEHTTGPKSGNFVEKLGTYNPKTKQHTLNTERVKHWLSVGAKASDTVHNKLVSLNVVVGKKVNVLPRKSPPKKEDTTKTQESTSASQEKDVSAENPQAEIAQEVAELTT